MEQGKRYLVIKRDDNGKQTGNILEWACLEVSTNAVKVCNLVIEERYSLLSSAASINESFWILKDNFDTIGNKKYQVLENLGNIPTQTS